MNRWVASTAVGAGALLVLAGIAVAGYELHQPATITRTVVVTKTVTKTVPKVVTVTRTAPPKVIIRTASGTPSMPCQDIGGSPEPGVITPGLPGDTTCTITLDSPMGASHLAQITLTTPNGDT